jgi:hypothetical protein
VIAISGADSGATLCPPGQKASSAAPTRTDAGSADCSPARGGDPVFDACMLSG